MIHILTLLAATEPTEAHGIAALGIDPLAILAQGFTFLVLFLILKKFAFSKIVATLEERRKAIEGSLEKADELTKQNEAVQQQVGKLLKEARLQAEDIISKSHEEAGGVIVEAESVAGAKAEKIIAEGKRQIEAEVVKARIALKQETLDLVAQATSVVLAEKVDAKKNEALIKKSLAEVKQ